MIAPRTSRALNAQTELTTRGNLLQGPLPRPGTWELGEDGSIAVHMTYEDGSSSDYVLTYAE